MLILALTVALPAHASPGHDHGDAPPAAAANAPKRQPDGSVFMPKAAQRELGVRTQPVVLAELPRALELTGTVIADPSAGGRVQALVAGRIEPGPRGLPTLGQKVKRGEVLAYVTPARDVLERGSQRATLAEARITREHKQLRLAKLKKLADTVPAHQIHELASEVEALQARERALSQSLDTRDTLSAPVSGVIASANVAAGQVVEARETLFEVVDPARLLIEALAYDAAAAQAISEASLVAGAERIPLKLVGRGGALRGQALPLVFRVANPAATPLAVGQPVRLVARSSGTQRGYRVPAGALMKSAANQSIVWVKTAPETYVPRVVTVAPLDGASVAVTAGLQAGERVVVRAAALVNQIR